MLTPLVVLVYSITVHTRVVLALGGGILGYLAFVGASLIAGRAPDANLTGPLALLAALMLGLAIRNRRRYRAVLAEKAVRDVELAAVAERAHIARELHDVVAHSLSVMVRVADGAAAVAVTDPSSSQAASQLVERVGRDALTDMRGLLGALADADRGPLPNLRDLDRLLESSRQAGLPVSVDLQDGLAPSEGMQLLVYRIVQESLTNALRYATDPSAVDVRICRDQDRLLVSVADDGHGSSRADLMGTGRGLSGLRARIEMYGGTLTAGHGPMGGWAVEASLPFTAG